MQDIRRQGKCRRGLKKPGKEKLGEGERAWGGGMTVTEVGGEWRC